MNGGLFNLEIASHEGVLYSEKCDFVVVPTATGEIGILRGHTPLISVVSKGRVRVYKGGSLVKEIEVNSGFVEVTQHHTNILLSDTR
jgi:F-type H+-transporting ATPase subunit epsilon